MCGRYVLATDLETIQLAFDLKQMPDVWSPRFNIAPTQPIAVITNEAPEELTFQRWGLVPAWADDPAIGNRMINARSETAHEKPSFRAAFKRRRCLIPATGFYEWQKADGDKIPKLIHLKDETVFALAGLWEIWHSPEGDELRTATILTTDANTFMEPIHNRMPVILPRSAYEAWLDPGEPPVHELRSLLQPYAPERMTAYSVSRFVNNPRNDTPECIEPVG